MNIIWNYFMKQKTTGQSGMLSEVLARMEKIGIRWQDITYYRSEVFVTENEKEIARRDRFLRSVNRWGIPDSAIWRNIRPADPTRSQSLDAEEIVVTNVQGADRFPRDGRINRDIPALTAEQMDQMKHFSFTLCGVIWPDGMGGDGLSEIDIRICDHVYIALHLPVNGREETIHSLLGTIREALDTKEEFPPVIRAWLSEEERMIEVAPFDLGPLAGKELILDDPGAEEIRKITNLRIAVEACKDAKEFPYAVNKTTSTQLVDILPAGYRLSVEIYRDKNSTCGIRGRSLGAAATCFIRLDGVNFHHQLHLLGMIRDQKALNHFTELCIAEAVSWKHRLGASSLSTLKTPANMWYEWGKMQERKQSKAD